MTIDEAIDFEKYLSNQNAVCNEDFMTCKEHEQIAEWLKELKAYRIISNQTEKEFFTLSDLLDNYDYIMTMSKEELAEWLSTNARDISPIYDWLDWLNEEHK